MAHSVLLHDCFRLDGAMGQLDFVLGDVVLLQGGTCATHFHIFVLYPARQQ
jgi:hypothetical protein